MGWRLIAVHFPKIIKYVPLHKNLNTPNIIKK